MLRSRCLQKWSKRLNSGVEAGLQELVIMSAWNELIGLEEVVARKDGKDVVQLGMTDQTHCKEALFCPAVMA